jgi:fluoride exporter
MNAMYVMIGGFFGGICRYFLGEWIHVDNFPIGTLLVNLAGCFFLGWFLTFASQKKTFKPEAGLLIGTGFTGSFTTFSTFSAETIMLIQESILSASIYIFLSIVVGIVFSYLGYKTAAILARKGETS